MLLKVKHEYSLRIAMFLEDGNYYSFDGQLGEKIILIKISNKINRYAFDKGAKYIKVLYKNKVGWINEKYVESL